MRVGGDDVATVLDVGGLVLGFACGEEGAGPGVVDVGSLLDAF